MTCLTALITPFDSDGNIDEEGFRNNIRFQKKHSIDGLVVLGTTGESLSLDADEKERLIEIAKEEADELPVIVSCGAASTHETIQNIYLADDLDADGALVVSPYYNKPNQEGLYKHFEAISKASSIPILVYNSDRTGVNIETSTLKRISKLKNVIGIKESSGSYDQAVDILHQIPKWTLFAGNDSATLALMSMGAGGLISAASNVIPGLMKELVQACAQNQLEKARKLHFRLLPFFRAATSETNPIPIKAAMQAQGLAAGDPRLPLVPFSNKQREQIKKILDDLCTSES